MNTPLPALQWKQNGVNHIVKLLPGGRIGALSDEILAEIRESNGKPDAKIIAIRSGNVELARQLQNEHIEGKELATTGLEEWEESMAGPSGPFDVTYCQPKTPTPPKGRPCILYLHGSAAGKYGSRKVVLPFCRLSGRAGQRCCGGTGIPSGPRTPLACCAGRLLAAALPPACPGRKQGALTPQESLWQGTAPAATWPLCAPTATVTAALAWSTARCCITPGACKRAGNRRPEGLSLSGWKIIFTMMRRVSGSCRASWPIWNAGKRSEDNYLPEGVNSHMASVSPLWDSDFSGLPRTPC